LCGDPASSFGILLYHQDDSAGSSGDPNEEKEIIHPIKIAREKVVLQHK
jgi:hypothetical protein